MLLLILAFNGVDRLALGLVLQSIKADLRLTDTQLGLLSGIAFALFYSAMGVPIARLADRRNRVTLISIATGLWCGAVALCGLAGSFLQLLLVRIGVAVGEAGCVPAANSLIADHFTRAERPRMTALYLMGVPLSAVIGYFLAGWLNELYGWRTMFIVLGLPGLALAALAWITLHDPRVASAPTTQPGLLEACRLLWARTTLRHLLLSYSVMAFFGYGIMKWQPTFLIRAYGLQTGELGTWLALAYGLGGLAGTYAGGALASRYAPGNESLQLKSMALAYCGFGVLSSLIYLAPDHRLAFLLMTVATAGVATVSGPLFATIQMLVPDRMRATSIALLYLFANLIGMGLGPLAAGALSDAWRPWAGEDSLRYALLALCPGYLWSAWYLWRASGAVAHDLKLAATDTSTNAPSNSAG